MQSLQLTELREQYQHRVDYTKCIDNLDTVEEEAGNIDMKEEESSVMYVIANWPLILKGLSSGNVTKSLEEMNDDVTK